MISSHRFSTFLRNPANLFVIIGLAIGLVYCAAIPFGAGFDEETHLERVFDISLLHFLPNRAGPDHNQTQAPIEFFKLSLQRRFIQMPAGYLFLPENSSMGIDRNQMALVSTRSIYQPLMFLPQALISGVFWLLLRLPVIPVTILMRIVGLLIYLAGGYLSIRLLPMGKWVMLVLALAPMPLFQAATVNTDGVTNAVSFVFIALVLNTVAQFTQKISPRRLGWLILASIGLGLIKPGLVIFLLLLLLLLLPSKRFTTRTACYGLWAAALASMILMFAWTFLSVTHSTFDTGGAVNLSQKLGLIQSHPFDFVWIYIKGTVLSFPKFFMDWAAAYGYWVGMIPWPVAPLLVLALAAALFQKPPAWLTGKIRLTLFAMGFLFIGVTIGMSYVAHYVPGEVDSLFSQGRYFIPFTPLLYLSLVGIFPTGDWLKRAAPLLSTTLVTAALVFYTYGLFATYYTYCDAYFFNGAACVQPAYRNLDPVTTVDKSILAGETVSQSFMPVCSNVSEVDVLIKQAAAPLLVTLLDPQGKTVLMKTVAPEQLHAGSFVSLSLDAPIHTPQKGEYELHLQALRGQVTVGLADARYYHDGWLMFNGVRQENADLIFRYICQPPGD